MSMNVLIAGGGTGGHVFPGISIADAIRAKNAGIGIHFVGTAKGIEMKLVPRAGYPLSLLPVSGLKGVSPIHRVLGLLKIPVAVVQSFGLLLKLKPSFVLGVGGYASGPLVFAAACLRFPTGIWEPNAHPGLTNRWLARFVDRAFLIHDETKKFLRAKSTIPSGMPLRNGLVPKARAPQNRLRVLIFGGSQGARGINQAVSEAVATGGTWLDHVEIVHQTGPVDFDAIKAKYAGAPPSVEAHPFLYDMPERYAWADIVFCRSGAGTVAELAATRKAAVMIPFPFATDDHQTRNAEVLEKAGAGILIPQRDFNSKKFVDLIQFFRDNPGRIGEMETKIGRFHFPNAAEAIAGEILKEIERQEK